jgi:hypothetical protein
LVAAFWPIQAAYPNRRFGQAALYPDQVELNAYWELVRDRRATITVGLPFILVACVAMGLFPGTSKHSLEVYGVVGAGVAGGYIVYRIVRMLPSAFFPPSAIPNAIIP